MKGMLMALLACGAMACDEPAEPTDAGAITNPPTSTQMSGATQFTATTTFLNDASPHLHAVVTITNLGAVPDTISYGGCWLYLRLFDNADRTGAPVYDQSTQHVACATVQRVLVVAPHDSTRVAQDFVTGALVPSGHYYAALLIAPNGVATSLNAGDVTLP